MPTSAIASTAAGLTWSPGSEPGRADLDARRRRGGAASRRPSASGRRCARRRTGRWAVGHGVSFGTTTCRRRRSSATRRVEHGARQPTAGRAADELQRATNIGTDAGAMPAKVSDRVRGRRSIIGLAKLVDEVTPVRRGDVRADGERAPARRGRRGPARRSARRRPNGGHDLATATGRRPSGPVPEMVTAGRSNIRFASDGADDRRRRAARGR